MTEDEAKQKATEVAQYLRDQEGVPEVKSFSILLILAIAGFILTVISFIHNMRRDKRKTLDIIKNPGILERRQLRRLMRQHLSKYKDMHEQIMNGIIHVAQQTSDEEITKLIGDNNV